MSIQVHPEDTYALEHEHEYEKNEMWYIVDVKEDAYIYYGVQEEMIRSDFIQKIQDNTTLESLRKVPVKKGDSFSYLKI